MKIGEWETLELRFFGEDAPILTWIVDDIPRILPVLPQECPRCGAAIARVRAAGGGRGSPAFWILECGHRIHHNVKPRPRTDGQPSVAKECPKCGQDVLPDFHVSSRDLGVSAPGEYCGAIFHRKGQYCRVEIPFDEHLYWPCDCGFGWPSPTKEQEKDNA